MAFGDETQLDAPVTPAPIFAYRALKGIFWGEQETPENAVRGEAATTKGNLKDMNKMREFRAQATETLSPGRDRKRIVLGQSSPTKSILRTPGALTPRRAMLRDLNVTFKDLRKSVSPELSHKVAASQRAGNTDVDANKENVGVSSKSLMVPQPAKFERPLRTQSASSNPINHIGKPSAHKAQDVLQISAPQTAAAERQPAEAFDSESYMRTTETEMKKLIKYGQKMREYARRQDEENNKLRALLEEAQMENKRLRRQLDASNPERSVTQECLKPTTTKQDRLKRRAAPPEPPTHAPNTHAELFDLSPPHSKPSRPTSSHKRPLPDLDEPSAHQHRSPVSSPKKQRRSTDTPTVATRAPPAPALDLPLRPVANGAVGVGRLAPDRAAAARARIRKRAELRKESVGARGEDSQLDWAGL